MALTGGKASRTAEAASLREGSPADGTRQPLKVVAHLSDGQVVKGHTEVFPSTELDFLLKGTAINMPAEIRIQVPGQQRPVSVSLTSLKALFFVKSFTGSETYKEIKFFEGHPSIEGLWVRVKFDDGEWTEGVIRNSHHFLTEPGFLVKPPDPQGNNEMVYVVKSALADFRILGVRHTY